MTIDSSTSASLLLRVRDPADHHAWALFESLYRQLIRRSCRRRGLQDADAEDVSQEVMARVAKAIREFDYAPHQGRFRAWLGAITTNAVRSHQMRTSHQPHTGYDLDVTTAEPDAAWETEFTEHVLAVALDRIRGEFEPPTWAAFEATWIRHESPITVAARLGLALHAVYVNKSRVLKRLEAEIVTLAADAPLNPPSR